MVLLFRKIKIYKRKKLLKHLDYQMLKKHLDYQMLKEQMV